MSILFKSITAASSYSLCLLILISRDTTLVISPFFIWSALKTSNEKLIGFVWILLSLTNCSLILVCVYPESTNTLTLKFFLFFVLTFACMFNSFSALLCQLGIIYFFWEFTRKISYTMSTQDLLQNLISCPSLHCLLHPILFEFFISSLTAFCFPLQSFAICPSLSHLKHFLVSFSFFLFQHFLTMWPYLL